MRVLKRHFLSRTRDECRCLLTPSHGGLRSDHPGRLTLVTESDVAPPLSCRRRHAPAARPRGCCKATRLLRGRHWEALGRHSYQPWQRKFLSRPARSLEAKLEAHLPTLLAAVLQQLQVCINMIGHRISCMLTRPCLSLDFYGPCSRSASFHAGLVLIGDLSGGLLEQCDGDRCGGSPPQATVWVEDLLLCLHHSTLGSCTKQLALCTRQRTSGGLGEVGHGTGEGLSTQRCVGWQLVKESTSSPVAACEGCIRL